MTPERRTLVGPDDNPENECVGPGPHPKRVGSEFCHPQMYALALSQLVQSYGIDNLLTYPEQNVWEHWNRVEVNMTKYSWLALHPNASISICF